MARTKQTARKSTTGRAARHQLHSAHQYPDHAGQLYTVVDGPSIGCTSTTPAIRKLGIHLYSLSPLSPSPEVVGRQLLASDGITGWGNARNYWPRVDVYPPMESIDACIEHHRREKVYRAEKKREIVTGVADAAAAAYARGGGGNDVDNEEEAVQEAIAKLRGKEPLPHIVPTWCCSAKFWTSYNDKTRYRSFILVGPEGCSTWEDIKAMGLWVVKFDLDFSPAMETDMMDWEPEWDEGALIVEKTGWVWVDKVEMDPPVSVERVSVGDEQWNGVNWGRADGAVYGEKSAFRTSLYHVWSGLTSSLWDCTYRIPTCDRCDDEVPHEECEVEMDEHYFDDDGQCVACRRVLEYRRRSKRIAKRKVEDMKK
ncbi:uncharacterized protein BO80DRAFT_389935 [Aspergillus ibericus CBS 121593]|uniref:Uncharacterized protein n=1 Tax=Aspergillus ibericus CBS 121593 TaxID=1448316 RepID=A0A395GPM3_9EURO|nr:hypothetical protein BO80DRAFT_389935 [Aspergillus ibericus CBS 121593]RAK97314.1 hypothetical protein BO80DRAFT_389935 [Aspergillus ibericus CBS 121593]